MFDSADIYSAGLAEEVLGAAIKGRRDKVIISTKATFRSGDGPNEVGSSRAHLIAVCDSALKRLQTDYIDLFQLHGFDRADTHRRNPRRARRSLRRLDLAVEFSVTRLENASRLHT
jgi:aryl-alcohol dehydrogenase-like predicted oxidoreductase